MNVYSLYQFAAQRIEWKLFFLYGYWQNTDVIFLNLYCRLPTLFQFVWNIFHLCLHPRDSWWKTCSLGDVRLRFEITSRLVYLCITALLKQLFHNILQHIHIALEIDFEWALIGISTVYVECGLGRGGCTWLVKLLNKLYSNDNKINKVKKRT